MSPNLRSRLVRLAIAFAVLSVIRELSIRRHEGDLHDWPRAE
jgi:hypothetical protein